MAAATPAHFTAKLEQASLVKMIVDSIKEILNEAVFDCSETGIELQAMETYRVALVSLELRSSGFDHYSCTSPISLHLDLTKLSQILRMCGATDRLTLSAPSASSRTTIVTFESQNRVSSFDLKQLTISSDRVTLPPLEFDATVTMPSREFAAIIKDLGNFGTDSVKLAATKASISFEIVSDSTSGSIVFSPSDDPGNLTTIAVKREVSECYPLKYLAMFTRSTPLSQSVTLAFSDHKPIQVTYVIEDAGMIRYLLAPKTADSGDGDDASGVDDDDDL